MKKHFLLFNLTLLLFAGGWGAEAAKKYRYIKREHGVRFQGNIPLDMSPFKIGLNLKGAYTYNWKGMLEVGPFFGFDGSMVPFATKAYSAGLLAEYNFMKNRGRQKLVPSVGLNLGVAHQGSLLASLGVHGALKFFVGKRTPFIVDLSYNLMGPPNLGMFRSLRQRLNISMGFAYYFDFY